MVGIGRWFGALLVATLVCAEARAQVDASRDAEARGLFDAAMAAYEDGRLEDAYAYFERSHALSRRPQLLFNLASTCERLRRDAEAIAFYEQYLEQVPDAENRRFVEGRITFLRSAAEERAATEARERAATREREVTGSASTGAGTTADDESIGDATGSVSPSAREASSTAASEPSVRTSAAEPPPSRHRGRRIALGVTAAVLASGGSGLAVWLARRDPGVQDPLPGDVGAGGVVVTLIGSFGP